MFTEHSASPGLMMHEPPEPAPSPGSPRPGSSGLSAGLEIRAGIAASAQERFPAALKRPLLNALLPTLSYFTRSASTGSHFHVALMRGAYAWLGLYRNLRSSSFAEYFNNLYWDVFWRRLYFYMDELHWPEYQVRTVIAYDLQVKMATELRWFGWLSHSVSAARSLQVFLQPGDARADLAANLSCSQELCI